MDETAASRMRKRLDAILAAPAVEDCYELYKDLLATGDPAAEPARVVVRAFHSYLRSFESKTASRSASRWGAMLGTAAVGAVGLQEIVARRDGALRSLIDVGVPELLQVGAPAVLEASAAVKSAQAWEVEARLMYDDVAWLLWAELWEISEAASGELTPEARRERIDLLVDPVVDPAVPDAEKAPLVVNLFLAILVARLRPLLGGASQA